MSFIVDWFWNLGGALKQWVANPIDDISYTVLFSGWSERIELLIEGWVDITSGADANPYGVIEPAGLVVGRYKKTTYERKNEVLDLESTYTPQIKTSLPGLNQVKSLAEIVYSIKREFRNVVRVAQ
jgi:hypothetical protein